MIKLPMFYAEAITVYYEIPLFLFIILGVYATYKLVCVRECVPKSALRDSISWFAAATVWFTLWAVDHVFHDLIPLPSHLVLFFHYVISHGFMLVAMIFITVAAFKLGKTCNKLPRKSRAKTKNK